MSTQVKKTACKGKLKEYFICYKYDRPHWFQFTENYLMDIIFIWYRININTNLKTQVDIIIILVVLLILYLYWYKGMLTLFYLFQF